MNHDRLSAAGGARGLSPGCRSTACVVLLVLVALLAPHTARAQAGGSITDTSVHLPTGDELLRVLFLRDYNTRIVVLGTMILGLAAGIVGVFLLLRKRALMGDALSHATLPGIGLAFILMASFGGSGKYLPGLLLGAVLSGACGLGCVLFIRRWTRLKEDAALGIVLSVFFGLGVAVLGVIQKMDAGHAAGLESFIYGKTASMLAADARMIAIAALIVLMACLMFFKEFELLCFDQAQAAVQGWPVLVLDTLMLTMVVLVTVIGLQAVGLILMIALLVIPPAAARFWTDHLPTMVVVSALIGAASGFTGAALSALVPRLPAGAIIVIVASVLFTVSLFLGTSRGWLRRAVERFRLERRVLQQHLLRALFEYTELAQAKIPAAAPAGEDQGAVPFSALLSMRSWSPRRLAGALRSLESVGLVERRASGRFSLSAAGVHEARRVVRNHRLWEMYLITHADIAPSHVDRGADEVEHVLAPAMVAELEQELLRNYPDLGMPPSPHRLARAAAMDVPRGASPSSP